MLNWKELHGWNCKMWCVFLSLFFSSPFQHHPFLWRLRRWVKLHDFENTGLWITFAVPNGCNKVFRESFISTFLVQQTRSLQYFLINTNISCRIHGCYMAIQSGHVKDTLVDFTGGLSESFNLRREENLPADLWNIIQDSFNDGSLLGAGIRVSTSLIEMQYPVPDYTKNSSMICNVDLSFSISAGTFLFVFGDNTCHYWPQ